MKDEEPRMSVHNAQKDAELEQYLKQFGYCSLFSHREDLNEAMAYVNMVAQASDNPPAVVAACFVYINTLLRCLHENEQLAHAHLDIKPPSPIIIPPEAH